MKVFVGCGFREGLEVFLALQIARVGMFDALGEETPASLPGGGGFRLLDQVLSGLPYLENL